MSGFSQHSPWEIKSRNGSDGNKGAGAKTTIKKGSETSSKHWVTEMPDDIKVMLDPSKFCEMCSYFENDLQFFTSSAYASKTSFNDEDLSPLLDQLLEEDAKSVARAAKLLCDLANGSEAVSAELRIKMLSIPRALDNIFHVPDHYGC